MVMAQFEKHSLLLPFYSLLLPAGAPTAGVTTTPGWVLRPALKNELNLSDSTVNRNFACIYKNSSIGWIQRSTVVMWMIKRRGF